MLVAPWWSATQKFCCGVGAKPGRSGLLGARSDFYPRRREQFTHDFASRPQHPTLEQCLAVQSQAASGMSPGSKFVATAQEQATSSHSCSSPLSVERRWTFQGKCASPPVSVPSLAIISLQSPRQHSRAQRQQPSSSHIPQPG